MSMDSDREQLLIGYDLLALELDDRYASEFTELIALLIDYATEMKGGEEVETRRAASDVDDQLEQFLTRSKDQWQSRSRRMPARIKFSLGWSRMRNVPFADENGSCLLSRKPAHAS